MVDARVEGRWYYEDKLFIIAISVYKHSVTSCKRKKGRNRRQ
jgi:hypothetical protein